MSENKTAVQLAEEAFIQERKEEIDKEIADIREEVRKNPKYMSHCSPFDDNIPWTWYFDLKNHPEWLWFSNQLKEAGRSPEPLPEGEFEDMHTGSQKHWQDYVDLVRNLQPDDTIPGLKIRRHGQSDNDTEEDAFMKKSGQNGPFVVNYYVAKEGADGEHIRLGPEDEDGPPPAGLFWFGKGKYSIRPPYEAGVFVGFRRKDREQLNPWDWEIVYARLDKRGRVILRAWEYNYLGMPLSALDNWTGRVAPADIIWIDGLENMSGEQRAEYVEETTQMWKALGHEYHGHGWVRNGLRSSFNLPPFQF